MQLSLWHGTPVLIHDKNLYIEKGHSELILPNILGECSDCVSTSNELGKKTLKKAD